MGIARSVARIALLVMLAAPSCGDGTNAPDGTGSLSGHITAGDDLRPVADVTLTIAGVSLHTDAAGAYRFPGVPVGQQTLTVTHPGYRTESVSVLIEPGHETVQDLQLQPTAEVPDGLTRLSAASGSVEGSVRLEWEPVSLTQVYSIYFSSSPGVTPATGTKLSPVASPFLVTGLTPGTTYYFLIVAVGQASEGDPSPEVHAVARSRVGITMLSPTIGAFVDTLVSVEARTTPGVPMASVTARIGAVTAPMTFASGDRWRATISLASLSSPATVLVEVLATDVDGHPGGASVSARFDRHPALTVTAPLNGEVARPSAAIRATCTDDSPPGCVSITVVNAETETVLFSGQGNVNSTFSLGAFDRQTVPLEIRATDNGGQVTVVRRTVFVEATSAFTQVANAGSGIVQDADASRLLVVNTGRWRFENPGGDTLRLVDRSTGVSTPVFQAESLSITGRLTPTGAIFVTARPDQVTTQLRELRNGTVSTLAEGHPVTLVEVAGGFAAWFESDGSTSRLMWRDLGLGITREVTHVGELNGSADLAPNGDLVYVADGEVFRFRGGASQQVTDNAGAGLRAVSAGTDGTAIVEGRRPPDCCDSGLPLETVLLDPGGDVVLASTSLPEQPLLYMLNGGWIAFSRYDASGIAQIWVRSPAGVEAQLTSTTSGLGMLNAMNAAGEVVFDLMRASPGHPPEPIGGMDAQPLYLGNELFLMYGAGLFRIT